MSGCKHVWTMFCQGAHNISEQPFVVIDWRVDICVKCYAKRQVKP